MDTGRLARKNRLMSLICIACGVLTLGVAIAAAAAPVEATPSHTESKSALQAITDAPAARATTRHAARIRKLQAVPFTAFPPRI